MNKSENMVESPVECCRELGSTELSVVAGGYDAMDAAGGWAGTVAGAATGAVIGGIRGMAFGGLAGFAVGAVIGIAYDLASPE